MQNDLKVIENDLVPVYETSTGEKVVYGTELHTVLGAPSVYREWIRRRITDIDAIENEDYQGVEISTPSGQTKKEHIIKLDTAKEMAMLERNEKGKQVRSYFIQIEKRYKGIVTQSIPQGKELLALAVLEAQKTIEEKDKQLQEKQVRIEQMRPKEVFADAVAASHTSILIGDLAKILKQNGVDIGQNRLFQWLRDKGYLIKRNGSDYNMPTQRSMELGLFEVKESTIHNPDGSVRINRTTKVTGKGQQYFINKFLGEVA